MTTPREALILWIADLRSGEYEQIRGYTGHGNKRCAVGVLIAQDLGQTTHFVLDNIKLGDRYMANRVMHLNDHYHWTFPQIADWLEQEVLPMIPDETQMTVGDPT